MRSLALVSRVNVLTAIRDHDLQGAADFLAALGFEGPGDDVLIERGRRYDARGVFAYAHGKATGDYLDSDRVPFEALKALEDLGFKIGSRAELDRPKSAPATRSRSTRAPSSSTSRSKPEPVVKLCPTCFTQLSVAGACDYCE